MAKLAISLTKVLGAQGNFPTECLSLNGTNKKLIIVASIWSNQGKFWNRLIILMLQ